MGKVDAVINVLKLVPKLIGKAGKKTGRHIGNTPGQPLKSSAKSPAAKAANAPSSNQPIAKTAKTLVRVLEDGTRKILTKHIDFQFPPGFKFDTKLAQQVEDLFSKIKAAEPNIQNLQAFKFFIGKNNEVRLITDEGILIGNLVSKLVPPNAPTQVLRHMITFTEFQPLVK